MALFSTHAAAYWLAFGAARLRPLWTCLGVVAFRAAASVADAARHGLPGGASSCCVWPALAAKRNCVPSRMTCARASAVS